MKYMSIVGDRTYRDLFYTLRALTFALFVIISAGAISSSAEDNILGFYGKAVKRADSPPDESLLSVECREKIDNIYVTFVGAEKGKVLLAAITQEKLKKPDKYILLKVYNTKSLENPILPTRDYVMDWGYVYDRNGDGKIDYVAYNVGPMPFKQKDFPEDYPKGGQSLNLSDIELLFKSMRLLFTHWADDNYDGKVDAVVFEAVDPERNWVEGWTAVRSTKYDGTVDVGWYFKEDINVREKDAERTGTGFKTRRIPGIEPVFGPGELAHKTKILTMFNEAAEKCKLTGDSFYRQ